MFIDTCRNPQCVRKYKVEEICVVPNSSKEDSEIKCPYCGKSYEKRTAGYFKTTKLIPEEEIYSKN